MKSIAYYYPVIPNNNIFSTEMHGIRELIGQMTQQE